MAYDVLPNVKFEIPLATESSYPTIENQYEAGIAQVSAFGLSRPQASVELRFSNISPYDRQVLANFVDRHRSHISFLWQHPDEDEQWLWRFVPPFSNTIRTHTGNPSDPYYRDVVLKLKRVYS